MTLARVDALFGEQQARGAFAGGQLVVQRGDERLIDLALGVARGWRGGPQGRTAVTPRTPFQVMSASKAVLAIAIARLEERGLIDVRAPVRRYIPEFCSGEVTVFDVLTHRSGVTLPQLSRHPQRWSDPALVLIRGLLFTQRRWRWPHPFGWWNTQDCFGHAGGFSVVASGDRKTGAGVAIVTNGNHSIWELVRRFAPLGTAIRKATLL